MSDTTQPSAELDSRPKYAEAFAAHAIGQFARKPFLRKEFVPAGGMLAASAFLFEEGAILGTVYRDVLETFIVPFFAEAGHWHAGEQYLVTESARVETAFKDATGVGDLFLISEMRREGQPEATGVHWSSWLAAVAEQKMELAYARTRGEIAAVVGVSYGAYYSSHFADLYEASYSNIDADDWKRAYQDDAVNQPEPAPFVPLKERQQVAISEFVEFCEMYYAETLPELRPSP